MADANDHLHTLACLISGRPHFDTKIQTAIAARFMAIKHRLKEKEKGGYCYDGNRTEPDSLGWRFAQYFGEPEPQDIILGKWDRQIEQIWHEAASAEYYYRYEKDWGWEFPDHEEY